MVLHLCHFCAWLLTESLTCPRHDDILARHTCVLAPVWRRSASQQRGIVSPKYPKLLFSSSFLPVAVNKHFGFDLCNNIMMCLSYYRLLLKPHGVELMCYLQPVYGGRRGADWHAVFPRLLVLVFISKKAVWFPFSWATAGVNHCSLMWMATKRNCSLIQSKRAQVGALISEKLCPARDLQG